MSAILSVPAGQFVLSTHKYLLQPEKKRKKYNDIFLLIFFLKMHFMMRRISLHGKTRIAALLFNAKPVIQFSVYSHGEPLGYKCHHFIT